MYGSIQVLGVVKTEFFPLGDRNQFLVYMDFEAGTDSRDVQAELRKLTAWLADEKINPEIESHIAYVGFGGPRFFLALSPVDPDPHRAFAVVNTRSPDDVTPLIDRVNGFLDENLPGARRRRQAHVVRFNRAWGRADPFRRSRRRCAGRRCRGPWRAPSMTFPALSASSRIGKTRRSS